MSDSEIRDQPDRNINPGFRFAQAGLRLLHLPRRNSRGRPEWDTGQNEREYAQPFAEALVSDATFRKWMIEQTEFAAFAEGAKLLHEEMKLRRSRLYQNWWRSHFTEACRCAGCSGKETDLLAIFEAEIGFRFAIHIEVKHPRDRFKKDGIQSRGYPLRARCWSDNPPPDVLPHHQATMALLFSETKSVESADHLPQFKTRITFESFRKKFPHATAPKFAKTKKPSAFPRRASVFFHRVEEFSVLGRPGSDLLFQALRLSTIGAGEFNGRVRDGIGFRPPASTTRSAKNGKRTCCTRGRPSRRRLRRTRTSS